MTDWPEGPGVVASSSVLDEAGFRGQMATAPEGDAGAGPSGEGVSWAVIQRGVPEDFVRYEHYEDEIWRGQLELGTVIDADLQRVVQRYWQEVYNVNRVGVFPASRLSLAAFVGCSLISPVRNS